MPKPIAYAFCTLITAATAATVASTPALSADLDLGEKVYTAKCARCHSLEVGGPQTDGPNLHGVFGRKAATAPGWEFSDALKQSNIVWTAETMNPYFAKPKEAVPGGTMNFIGLKKAEERDAVISYLEQATK
jgi:cytochrome c